MSEEKKSSPPPLVHIGKIFQRKWSYLLLRKTAPREYQWFEMRDQQEVPANVVAENTEEAIRQAKRQWKHLNFTTLKCGFRFTLPERDEIGGNALFHQLAASYASVNGIYFDDEVGFNCIVNNPSREALAFLKYSNDKSKQLSQN